MKLRCAAAAVWVLAGLFPAAAQDLALGAVFTDHMVVQRDELAAFWGAAAPGAVVRVALAGASAETVADSGGRWRVDLPAMPAGGPHEAVVRSGETSLRLADVLVGDVWICSGQSNMAWPVFNGAIGAARGEAEVAAADWPGIRLLSIAREGASQPQEDAITPGWRVCSPETAGGFSAVGYFFGRALHRELGVPIGLVNASYGGTMAETWMSAEGLRRVPSLAALMDGITADPEALTRFREAFDARFAAWLADLEANDGGLGRWNAAEFDDGDWDAMTLPALWERAGHPGLDGLVWFRKDVAIPDGWAGRDLRIRLGAVNDRLTLWVNGVCIEAWAHNAQTEAGFLIPSALVRPGRNVVAARVYDMGGPGGLYGDAEDYWIRPEAAPQAEALALAGPWRYRVGFEAKDYPAIPGPPPFHPDNPNTPSSLYNGMIAPLTALPVRGVIWYQGEANVKRAAEYGKAFPALIADWRAHWDRPALPFLFVQLANYLERSETPGDDPWAELREAQASALTLPRTAMAVTIDIGDGADIHPLNKQDVGERLALAARATAYGEDVAYSGPVFAGASAEGGAMRVRFRHADGGLTTRDGAAPRGFAVAGEDRVFHWAEARIDGESVIVSSAAAPRPVAVRYGWAANPDCTLYNGAGLPAAPFRSDDWPLSTAGATLELRLP